MDRENHIIIDEYRKKLETLGVRAKKIILYGSHAAGTAREDSDLDLVVVSNDLKDMDLWERLCLLGRARKGTKRPMEILGYTEEEYESDECGSFIRDEVKAKGIEVI
jgi:predicted nucleotidyltransferase